MAPSQRASCAIKVPSVSGPWSDTGDAAHDSDGAPRVRRALRMTRAGRAGCPVADGDGDGGGDVDVGPWWNAPVPIAYALDPFWAHRRAHVFDGD